ncbi:MAG: DUF4249 family protein [Bacteroidales bacterium]|nr:DUF4249 family protein [Bacteroidales bacterium]
MVSCHDSGQRYNPYEDRIEDIDTLVTKLFLCADRKLTASGVSALEPMAGYFYNRLLCSDSLIDGSNHHAELLLIMLKDTNEIQPFKHEYVLNVESVSPERYQYLHDVSAITGMSQMFSEPAEVYSNVEGAYGIFGANARLFLPLTLDTLHSPSTAVPPIIRSVGIPPVSLSSPYVR